MSPRRSAQLGLLAVCLVVVTSLSVLVASARDSHTFKPMPMPNFRAVDVDGLAFSSTQLKGKVTVLYFYSVRCPVCNEYTSRVTDLARQVATDRRVQFVGVHSTAEGKAVAVNHIRVQAAVSGLSFRTIDDRDGSLAKRMKVSRTPTVVIVGEDGLIRYQGSIDDSRAMSAVKSTYARDALTAVLAGKPVFPSETPEIGCAIFKD